MNEPPLDALPPPGQAPADSPADSAAPGTPPGAENPSAGGKPFEEFGLAPDVLEALGKMGIRTATPIQELVIPPILAGRDVIGKAETGTGKTIGFGAPVVGKIDTHRVAVQALVLTPTRELAQQVAGVMEALGAGRELGVALVVGGVHASGQVLKLRSRSQVVVGTPGRVLDFLRDRTLSLVWCETAVLDEADRMLDMGFIDDVSAILDRIPSERQTLLFSATIPPEVERLSRSYMQSPEMHSTALGLATVSEIRQLYLGVEFRDKFRALRRILDEHSRDTFIIFCNTRRQAIDLDRMLWGHGYAAGALHGEQEQDVRFRILEAFRRKEIRILVATDVASRGLDIDDVGWIINYEVPDEPEGYVHRIGRTGRAWKNGTAVTLVAGKEVGDWNRIVRTTRFQVEPMGAPLSAETRSGEGERRGGRGRGERRGGSRGGRRREEATGREGAHRERGRRERSHGERDHGERGHPHAREAASGRPHGPGQEGEPSARPRPHEGRSHEGRSLEGRSQEVRTHEARSHGAEGHAPHARRHPHAEGEHPSRPGGPSHPRKEGEGEGRGRRRRRRRRGGGGGG